MNYDNLLVEVLNHKVRYYESVLQMLANKEWPIADLDDLAIFAREILNVAEDGAAEYGSKIV